VEDLLELEDNLADLVDHTDEEAYHTQGSGFHNSQREEAGAFHHTVQLAHSQALVVGFHREHSQAQVAAVAVEEGLGHVVRTVLEEVAVRNLKEVADFCLRYHLALDAKRHSSA